MTRVPRVAIALCGSAALFVVAALVWQSRPILERRAAFHRAEARKHLESRAFDRAREELLASLRLRPKGVEARRELAALEVEQGNWELAFVELQSVTALQPDDSDSWIALADLMVKRGWLEAPEAALDKALEAAPQRPDAHEVRAEIRFRLGRYHGALVDAEAALASAAVASDIALRAREVLARLARRTAAAVSPGTDDRGPEPAPPRRLRDDRQIDVGSLGGWAREAWPGRLGEMRKQLDARIREQAWTDAEAVVQSARLAYPGRGFPPYLAGVLEMARGRPDNAEAQFVQALAAAPRNPVIVAALARAWSRKKDAASAAQELLRLAQQDRSFALARYLAARAYVEARDPIHAEAALRLGLETQPDSPVPYRHLADYYFGLDRLAEAIGVCEQGLERFPGDVGLRMMLAQMETSAGRAAEAVRAYRDVLSRRPDLDVAEYRLAMLLASDDEDGGPPDGAAEMLARLRDDRPSDPLLLDVLGWLHHRVGDRARAEDLLAAAVRTVPEEPRPHFHLAALYESEGKRELARSELNAALASDQPFPERLLALRMLREAPSSAPRAGSAGARK